MALVFAAIAPHGFPLIPELSDDAGGALATRAAMQELGRRCAATQPDVIVVATPHGTRVDGAIALVGAARAAGTLRWQDQEVEMNVPLDQSLTDAIAAVARQSDLPVALVSFGGNRRDQSTILLDWGTLTPLWFLGHDRKLIGHGDALSPAPREDNGPSVVVVAPSRSLPWTSMIHFGAALAEAIERDDRRIAFVASCDWAHTHAADGPYGFHPAAAEVDQFVVQAIKANDPHRLIDLDPRQVEDAAIDGLWQTLMLAGLMQHTPLQGDLLSYEVPTYYGMLVAAFHPVAQTPVVGSDQAI